MTRTVIYDRNDWRLTSYGNGWAYLLEDLEDEPRSVWFQDDDAQQFRDGIMDSSGFLSRYVEERFADYSDVMQVQS